MSKLAQTHLYPNPITPPTPISPAPPPLSEMTFHLKRDGQNVEKIIDAFKCALVCVWSIDAANERRFCTMLVFLYLHIPGEHDTHLDT